MAFLWDHGTVPRLYGFSSSQTPFSTRHLAPGDADVERRAAFPPWGRSHYTACGLCLPLCKRELLISSSERVQQSKPAFHLSEPAPGDRNDPAGWIRTKCIKQDCVLLFFLHLTRMVSTPSTRSRCMSSCHGENIRK